MTIVPASPQSLHRSAIASFAAVALCLAMPAWTSSVAQAQGRSIAIGLGVASGLSVLSNLPKSEKASKKRSASKSSKKSTKTYAAKKKSTGSASRSRNDDAPAKAESEPAIENAAASRAHSPAAPATTGAAAMAGAAAGTLTFGQATAISSKSEIKSAQEHLQYMGYDVRDANGTLDLKTKIAIMQFQDSIGQPSTGVLTVQQLQTLFLKVSERTAASK